MIKTQLFIITTLFVLTLNKCAYRLFDDSLWPYTLNQTNNQVMKIVNITECKQYLGYDGCCNNWNDAQQKSSYIQISSVFGFDGDGCDHCAINLKRFWCQYACSPRQADFLKVTNQNTSVIDPTDPSKNKSVQKLTLTVQAKTACDLYNSCKRIGFVTSVSAMQSPAGFLNFQGHNAVDDAQQYIDVVFSYDETKALTFSDNYTEPFRKKLSTCDTKIPATQPDGTGFHHGFKFKGNCTCNSCQQACDKTSGFIYTQSSVLQGFNWILVGSTYLVVGIVATLLTIKRNRDEKAKDN